MKILNKKALIGFVASVTIASSLYAEANTEKVYAVVNGENITTSDITVALRDPRIKFDTLQPDQKKQVLENIVEQKVLAQEAYKSDVVKSDLFKTELEKLKQKLAYQIWIRDLSQTIKVSDDEVKKYYEANKATYVTPEEFKASHILVKTQAEADELIKQLSSSKDMKKDFTAMAKEKSVGPSGPNGGDLGWFTKEKMLPEFSAAAAKLNIGQITKTAVKTQYGFHVIYLEDKKKAATLTFDKVETQLKQEMLQKEFITKVQKIAADLKSKSKIEYK